MAKKMHLKAAAALNINAYETRSLLSDEEFACIDGHTNALHSEHVSKLAMGLLVMNRSLLTLLTSAFTVSR